VPLLNTQLRYGAVAQTLHWATAILVVSAWVLGQVGENLGGDGPRAPGLIAHVMVGLAVLLVLAVRLGWRLVDAPPLAEPTRLGAFIDRVARWAHYALLVLLFVAPAGGIAYQLARGEPLYLFGFYEVASPGALPRATSRAIKEMHEVFANLLMILALAHGAAALFHHWVLRDNVLRRMWPFGGHNAL
jgi:cytochrome b561